MGHLAPITTLTCQASAGAGNALFSTFIQTLLVAQCGISPPQQWPADAGQTLPHLGSYDFIVIGAGTAGSVMASRLSENPNWNVLVLEAGGDPVIESEIPALFFTTQRTRYTWNYFTEPDGKSCLGYENEACYWPRGKMIGGTGAINAMLYVRGNRRDYDSWERNGNPTWGWDHVLPVFEKSVFLGQLNNSDSRAGLVLNTIPATYPEIEGLLFGGPAELGVPLLEAFREGADIGFTAVPGYYQSGRRFSTGKSYLAAAKDRPNLHVLKDAVATKINFDASGQKVIDVTFTYQGKHQLTAQVTREVVVSAGAIDSPKLIMLSGIGPQKHLQSLGVPVVRNLRVGDNLQDHSQVPLFFKINKSRLQVKTALDKLDDAYRYLVNQTGPLAGSGVSRVTGFINTDAQSYSPYPDVSFYHAFAQLGTSDLETIINAFGITESIKNSIREKAANDHVLIVIVTLLQPKSRGTLRLRSADPRDPPKLFANYLDKEQDVETFLRGIGFQMQLEKTQAYRDQGAEIIKINIPECDQFVFECKEYWKCYMKYMVSTAYHMSGTVKMGPDTDPGAVLDWRLRVKGVKGLRVADASIIPDIPSGNTNAPTIMIAEKAAEFINEDWGHRTEQGVL